MLSSVSTKVLDGTDLSAVQALLDRDPVTNVFVASRVRLAGVDPWRLGGELWGYYESGRLTSLCYAGANLVPVEAGPDAIRSFAERARRQGRRCSSIVGPAQAAADLWRLLEPVWGPARDVRPVQPLMVADQPSREVAPDPLVRRVRPDELDLVMPACVAMFTEEVGVSPLIGDGGTLYRARVAELIAGGRAFARIEDGRVVFKAEIGAVTRHACQIQGVWVAPERRGEGLSEIGMAAVLRHALSEVAPIASLYVNSYNGPARAAYRRVGFAETGAFMSVLF
ncbi:GNAT family N-acetyltransferase [Streptomyces sp. SID5474]|nr:GNAT family N-acetyltransferase [Embleya scabrispora]MYS87193.1 GNAT family N-acetyltransferase [Streptomyces sp. SID5474]